MLPPSNSDAPAPAAKSQPQPVVEIPGISRHRRSTDTPVWKRSAFLWCAGVVLAAIGLFAVVRNEVRKHKDMRAAAEVLALQYEIDKLAARDTKIREAILRGEVTYGMSEYQVIQAKGHPDYQEIGPSVFPSYRDIGAVQMWVFEDQTVLFDVNNRVMGWTKDGRVYWIPQPGAKQQE